MALSKRSGTNVESIKEDGKKMGKMGAFNMRKLRIHVINRGEQGEHPKQDDFFIFVVDAAPEHTAGR